MKPRKGEERVGVHHIEKSGMALVSMKIERIEPTMHPRRIT